MCVNWYLENVKSKKGYSYFPFSEKQEYELKRSFIFYSLYSLETGPRKSLICFSLKFSKHFLTQNNEKKKISINLEVVLFNIGHT